METELRLSPSKILDYEDCPRRYYYRYVEKWEPLTRAAALGFGTAMHAAFEASLRGQHNVSEVNPKAVFLEAWEAENTAYKLKPPETWTLTEFETTGADIADKFQPFWKKLGWMPFEDQKGELLIEKPLSAELAPGVKVNTRIDAVALDTNAKIVLLDFKTPGQKSLDGFARVSPQLAIEQWVIQQNTELLGFEKVDTLTFVEAIKRKVATKNGKGPEIIVHDPVPAHSGDEIADRKEYWVDVSTRIQHGKFPRTPRMAHNTSCDFCDFKDLCWHSDASKLKKRG